MGCKLAFGLQLEFWLQNGVQICSRTCHSYFPAPHIECFPDKRPCGVCGAAPRLRLCEQALRTFRGLTSYASLLTCPAVLAGRQLECVPANRPFDFSRPHIVCFPDNRPCGFCGAASRLRHSQQALQTLQGRASHASLTAGPAVFARQHLWDTCVRAAEMRFGCENPLSVQIGVWAANWQSAANWRLVCKLAFALQTGIGQQIGDWAANWRLGCNWSSGCKMAFEFVPEQAIRTFRGLTSYASLLTGPAVFAGPQLDCIPANRPFDFSHRVLP